MNSGTTDDASSPFLSPKAQEEPAPPRPAMSPRIKILLAAVFVVTILTTVFDVVDGIRNGLARRGGDPPSFVDADWRRQGALGLSVDCPVALGDAVDLFKTLPADLKDTFQTIESCQGTGARGFVLVRVLRVRYVPGSEVSLDEVAKSMIEERMQAIGDPTAPPFESERRQVASRDGRRAHCVGRKKGAPVHVDLATFQEGPHAWVVDVVQVSDAFRDDAARILDGVRLASSDATVDAATQRK